MRYYGTFLVLWLWFNQSVSYLRLPLGRVGARTRALPAASQIVLNDDVNAWVGSVGEKQALQEFSQCLFNGSNPTYNWSDEYQSIVIMVKDTILLKYRSGGASSPDVVVRRKSVEVEAARSAIASLFSQPEFTPILYAYLTRKLNRANQARLIRRSQLFTLAASKSIVVLVDVENIPDVRKVLYVTHDGDVRFLAPPLPIPRKAPSLGGDSSSNDEDVRNIFQDEDVLILTYSHEKGLTSHANRIIQGSRRDLADSLMLFDLGALSLITSLSRIILVTQDKFGLNAEDCFHNDSPHKVYSNIPVPRNVQQFIDMSLLPNTAFIRVDSCAEAARAAGRAI